MSHVPDLRPRLFSISKSEEIAAERHLALNKCVFWRSRQMVVFKINQIIVKLLSLKEIGHKKITGADVWICYHNESTGL